jgi:hypothetical protein
MPIVERPDSKLSGLFLCTYAVKNLNDHGVGLTEPYLTVINRLHPFSFSANSERIKPTFAILMKRKILLFAAIAVSSLSFAQSKPSFGIRAGVTSSSMKGDAVNSLQDILSYTNDAVTTSAHTGFFAGANVSIPVSDLVSIEPGVYYAQKGYAMRGDLNLKGVEFLGANAKADLTSQYIDMPVLLKLNFNGLQLFAGPQISYLAKADLKTTAGVLGFNLLNKTMDATDQFNRWDAGVTGGVGYQFANGVNISASYDHGLSKLDANQNFDSYNRAFKLGLGFSF